MPIKRPKKSRKNSAIDAEDHKLVNENAKDTNIQISEAALEIIENISSAENSSSETHYYEEQDGNEQTSDLVLHQALSRTSMLLLDYLQFKAARIIQRHIRGWLARTVFMRKKHACLIIQTEWRRFHASRMYYRILEERLQERAKEHYFRSAQKIEAVWRGWWVREHVHNHTTLVHLQVLAGEELLQCIAFKLHHLLRTHQIPGIYSLRNSKAFSKVEALLASLSFKACTERIRKAHDFREHQIQYARKQFKKSSHGTQLPFPGSNIHNVCVPKCSPLYNEKQADRKMTKILRMYEEANRKDSRLKKLQQKSNHSQILQKTSPPASKTFCGDVVHSLKKWKIVANNNLTVDPKILQQPENLENFLKEIKSSRSLLHHDCYCGQDYVKKVTAKKSTKTGSCI